MADSSAATAAAPSSEPAAAPSSEASEGGPATANEEGGFQNESSPPPTNNEREGRGSGGAERGGGGTGAGGGGGAGRAGCDDDEGGKELSLTELMYSASSYHAIAKPVSATMILAALATVYINTPETLAEYGQGMADAYQVFSLNPSEDSAGETLGKSLTNALIIVSVIGGMTFVIVLLYKYRCMKCLIGYMVFSSAMLLGLLGGVMFDVAINKYSIPISIPTFCLILWNFAVVGVIAIFYQRGIPMWVNQSYLIATSVILSWQLSHFDEWTAWTLLAMLALYDLCAVLTPCGPLKLLVNLMQEDDSPDMPGLLYEAELPEGANRPQQRRTMSGMPSRSGSNNTSSRSGARSRSASRSRHSNSSGRGDGPEPTGSSTAQRTRDEEAQQQEEEDDEDEEEEEEATATTPLTPRTNSRTPPRSRSGRKQNDNTSSRQNSSGVEMSSAPPVLPLESTPASASASASAAPAASASATPAASSSSVPALSAGPASAADGASPPTGTIPLAIAKIYRLPLSDPSSAPQPRQDSTVAPLLQNPDGVADGATAAAEDEATPASTPNARLALEYTPEQLRTEVEVIFPQNGGKIVTRPGRDGQNRYVVLDRHGTEKRVLLLDRQGKVFEELERSSGGGVRDWDEGSEYAERASSIKLGLGDFIFYSVLVGKAALYSFATFAACMLVILAGLGSTLVLLAVWKQALPALPISIFLGVLFYLLTRTVVEPWIEDVLRTPLYV